MSRARVKMTCTTPRMLHSTSGSRAVALKYYHLESTAFLNGKPIYFDFNRDMLFLVTSHTNDSFCGLFMALPVSTHHSPPLEWKLKHLMTGGQYGKYVHTFLGDLRHIQRLIIEKCQTTANTIRLQNRIEGLLTDTWRLHPVRQIVTRRFMYLVRDDIWAKAERERVCIPLLVWL